MPVQGFVASLITLGIGPAILKCPEGRNLGYQMLMTSWKGQGPMYLCTLIVPLIDLLLACFCHCCYAHAGHP
jgi:hypothetical protein